GIAQYRGLAGNRINISIDNANMKEVGPNSMDPPLSHFPAALTESLKVKRGIGSVSSGIETMGGTMSVESRKGEFAEEGEDFTTSGAASIGYSSADDGHVGALMGSFANQNHKVYLSGSEEKGRDYTFKDNDKVAPSKYDRNAFSTGYAFQQDGHEFGINYSNNDTGHTGTLALPMDIIYVRGGLYDANYKWDLGNGLKLKTNLYYQKMRHLMNNFTLRGSLTGVTAAASRQNRTKVEAGGLDISLGMPLFGGEMEVGFNGDQSNHDGLITNPNNAAFAVQNFNRVERDRYSIFSEWNGEIAQNLSLELGARLTYARTNSDTVSSSMTAMCTPMMQRMNPMMYRMGCNHQTLVNDFNNQDRTHEDIDVDLTSIFRYTMNDNLDVEVGMARKNRMPSYQERYLWLPLEATGGLADGRVYMGNQNLEHETAYQFELGFDWHTDKAYFAPRFFYHYVDNYIQGVPLAESDSSAAVLAAATGINAGTLRFDNIQAQLYGVDFDAGYAFDDNWRVDAGLNYVRGVRMNAPTPDADLYRIAPLNGRTQVTYENMGWMGAIEGVFYADQGDVAGYNNEIKTKGYMLLNLRANYEPIDGLVIGAGIENVLDTNHFDHLGGYNRVTGGTERIHMQGRNMYATLGYSW
ncbi:MAG: TonB-dependent receptor, partial [Methylococcaceae bacterium]|nr:TonB-dependent receptor [Methylococcaceae bacterium]